MHHFSMALINLNHPAHYFGVGPFQVSIGNAVVIVTMFVIFGLALFLKFPEDKED
jgi:hypothetical protein